MIPCTRFLGCAGHCANWKVGLVLVYPVLTQPVLSSRVLLKDLLLVDGKLSKHVVPPTSGGAQGSLGLSLLFFEAEELTSLNGHTMSSRLWGRWRKIRSPW